MWKTTLAAGAALALLCAPGLAQQKKAPAQPRTAESIECSKQADAKNLHGKARQKFRSNCIRDMRKKAT